MPEYQVNTYPMCTSVATNLYYPFNITWISGILKENIAWQACAVKLPKLYCNNKKTH